MPISTFYNHEANWLASVLSVLQAGGTAVPTANIQASQSLTISRSPRIEVECEGDERASDQMDHRQKTIAEFPQLSVYTVSSSLYHDVLFAQNGYRIAVDPSSFGTTVYVGLIANQPNAYCGIARSTASAYTLNVRRGTSSSPGAVITTLVNVGDVVTYYSASASTDIPFDEWFFSHRACTLATRVVTNRTALTAQDHGAIRARVRWLYSREAQKLVSPVVTLYQTLDVAEQGSNVFVRDSEADREDVTEFRHRIEYGIIGSAVPTV